MTCRCIRLQSMVQDAANSRLMAEPQDLQRVARLNGNGAETPGQSVLCHQMGSRSEITESVLFGNHGPNFALLHFLTQRAIHHAQACRAARAVTTRIGLL